MNIESDSQDSIAYKCSELLLLNNDPNEITNQIYIFAEDQNNFNFEKDCFIVKSNSNGIFGDELEKSQPSRRENVESIYKSIEGDSLSFYPNEVENNIHYRGISFGGAEPICSSSKYLHLKSNQIPEEIVEKKLNRNESDSYRNFMNELKQIDLKNSYEKVDKINSNITELSVLKEKNIDYSVIHAVETLDKEVNEVNCKINCINNNENLKEAIELVDRKSVV